MKCEWMATVADVWTEELSWCVNRRDWLMYGLKS